MQTDLTVPDALAFGGRRTTTAVELADFLRLRILSGELVEGSRLPAQDQFAAQLGLGRSVLREALAILEKTGYIETRRGARGGSFVMPPTEELPAWLGSADGRMQRIEEAFEMRIAVEGHAAWLAATRVTDSDRAEIQSSLDTSAQDRSLLAFRTADAHFHAVIAAVAHNSMLAEAIRNARAELFLVADRLFYRRKPDLMQNEHRRIAEAVLSQDPELARQCMVEHLQNARAELASVLRGEQP